MAQRVTVRERIDPAITASLFANYRSSADAVMELVDNAIDSRLTGTQLEVMLQVHPTFLVIESRGEGNPKPLALGRPSRQSQLLPHLGRRIVKGGQRDVAHTTAITRLERSTGLLRVNLNESAVLRISCWPRWL